MADGPRCKRRKQANPKRSSVPNFNNGLEASSDSDDEDKLHIVEEESQEPGGRKRPSTRAVLPHNRALKEDCVSEEDGEKDALVEEILQQGDTAIIYPEAPEERGAAETGGADENGTPDALPLHMCPYCSRGYKRNASLKEHIKYRHETNDDNYSCSHCSYTFTYRSQLERHMSHHRGAKVEPRTNQKGGGGAEKFKCNECSKAFKYKHHLKEHLRIHSGEKPYECSNCHKRFSHSGSYSSHISSKKCAPAHFPNGLHHPPLKPHQVAASSTHVAIAPARNMDSKPLQEQIPVTQIKTEPVEEDIKPVVVPPVNGVNRPAVGTGLSQGVAMVVPTVGLMSPIGININDLQNVLGKVLVNGTQGKQGFVVQQPQQQIISLPAFVDHDGTTKIIINYSISPTAATTANTQPASIVVKNSPPVASAVPIVAAAPIPSKTEQSCASDVQEFPTDLSISKKVKEEPVSELISDDLGIVIIALDEPSPTDDVLSVLKNAFASNSRPSHGELEKIAEKVSIPAEVVRKWFTKMNKGGKKVVKSLEQAEDLSVKGKTNRVDVEIQEEDEQGKDEMDDNLIAKNSNNNVTGKNPSASDSTTEPLDLSLPKSATPELPTGTPKETTTPLNLACISKDQLEPRALYVTTPQSGNSNFVTATQIPTLVAIAGQGTVGCLSAINPTTKQRTILIPQLTYTYAPPAGSAATGKTVLLNGHKEKLMVNVQKSAPSAGGQENDDSKKRKMGDQGVFPCDLCNKVFQKASSLLRHKYEHTGKRPHECTVCKKAFKHKHHLIEHARLHTGIKPYECDKCGKRFSHSGSYSQHMNHRYSYCKRNPFSSSASVCSSSASSPPAETQDHRYSFSAFSSPPETRGRSNGDSNSPAPTQRSDSQATSEDEEEDEEYEEEAMCVEDIRVVQVDDTEGGDEQIQDGGEEEEEEEEEESGEEMEIELGEGSGEDSDENEEAGKDSDISSREKAKNAK
uniref:Zinc finger E-box binding homeobox 1a n=1 Tax=Periophthalmus magnuspinnatus TaxID=409849 RepID=A0A3B3ZNS6_9GOBI